MVRFILIPAFLIVFLAIAVNAQSLSFTYQGKLNDNGIAANGTYEMRFTLYSDTSENPIGVNTIGSVAVNNGIFTVQLAFPSTAFDGNPRFLEIAVRPAGSQNQFTALSPRQQVLSAPYSLRALNAGTADLATNSLQLGGILASGFIRNSTAQQTTSNFNISGDGTLGGDLSANTVNSTTKYFIGNNPVLSVPGSNTFVGLNTGAMNTNGNNGTFVGNSAGAANTGGIWNSFFGSQAGKSNTTGNFNSFFGYNAGAANTTAINNSFFGQGAGFKNTTGQDNTFVGNGSGQNSTTSNNNSFIGSLAGFNNTTGANNTFLGFNSGNVNNGGGANTFIGVNAGLANVGSNNNTFIGANSANSNLTGSGNTYLGANSDGATLITNAVAIGQNSYAGQSNSLILGSVNGINGATADTNVGIGTTTPQTRFHVVGDSFLVGKVGVGTTTPTTKLYIKDNADTSLTVESSSPNGAGILLKSTSGFNPTDWRIFSDGSGVTFFDTGRPTNGEVMRVGRAGGGSTNDSAVDIFGDLYTSGFIIMERLGTGGTTSMCWHPSGFISNCSSSLRYKKDLSPFTGGLSLLAKLDPITFRWKIDDKKDLGFAAEDVEKVEPLLVTYNNKGEVEGVKYDRISAVLVNAVKEQQTQIEAQQKQIKQQQQQIDALKKLVCAGNKDADVCREQP